ncbi:MAG: Glutamine-dependent 2-keto-4-methylthiobutyrate transaminase [Myxococcaceae bacterium]|nr:Glutamine-dependent 2-keto-4-methylthiobutyrate transaminase [Myxococcaceae bacterium]
MPRYPRFSDAATGLSAQVYTSLLSLAQASGREVFALNVGDTHLEPPEVASVSALASARFPGMHRYAEVRGEPALLDAIVDDLARRERPVPRARIQVTPGGTAGLDLACRALLKPGDEVILLAPYWPLIRGIISACGAVAVEVPLYTELARPDFDLGATLEAALSERTAAIYVNTPNNPTGVVLTAGQVDELAAFTARHDLWLLSDEAYERLSYDEAAPRPVWLHAQLRERSVVLHTLSKSYGLSGARVAYLHGPEAAIAAIAGLSTFANYCAARPMQVAAAQALQSPEGERWVEAARSAYRDAAERTARALRVAAPASGTFLFFDLRPHLAPGQSAGQLLQKIARAGVVLTPGSAAGAAYADWARLCFTCVPPAALERALATLSGVLYASPDEAT